MTDFWHERRKPIKCCSGLNYAKKYPFLLAGFLCNIMMMICWIIHTRQQCWRQNKQRIILVYSYCVQDAILKAAKRSTHPTPQLLHCSFRQQRQREITPLVLCMQSGWIRSKKNAENHTNCKAKQQFCCFSNVRLSHLDTAGRRSEAQTIWNL